MNNLSWIYVFLADYLIILQFLSAALLRLINIRLPVIKGLAASAIAGLIATLIKDFFYFPRPFILIGKLPLVTPHLDGSFPSSHTAVSFALAFTILLKNRHWGSIFVITSVFVAIGRLGSGVHTLTDVFGGIILAVFSTFFVKYWTRKLKNRHFRDWHLVTHSVRLLKLITKQLDGFFS